MEKNNVIDYINNENAEANVEKSTEGAVGGIVGQLHELQSPARDGELEQAWTLKRVGSEGLVVIARVFFRPDVKEKKRESSASSNTPGTINSMGNAVSSQQKGATIVSIFPLSQLSRDLAATSIGASEHSMKRWHPTGNFYRRPKPINTTEPSREVSAYPSDAATTTHQSSSSSSTKNGRTNLHAMLEDAAIAAGMPPEGTVEEREKDDKQTTGRSRGSSNRHHQSHLSLKQLQQWQYSVEDEVEDDNVEARPGSNPAIVIPPYVSAKPPQCSSAVVPIVPASGGSMLEQQHILRKLERIIHSWCETFYSNRYSAENVLFTGSLSEMTAFEADVGAKRTLHVTVHTESKRKRLSINLPSESSQSSGSGDETITQSSDLNLSAASEKHHFATSSLVQSLGVLANNQFGRILFEQERVKSQFIQEVKQLFLVIYRDQLLSISSTRTMAKGMRSIEIQNTLNKEMESIVRRYHGVICEELLRQEQDFFAARQRDMISQADPASSSQTLNMPLTPKSSLLVGSMCQNAHVQVNFRYMDILKRAIDLPKEVCSSLAQL